MPARKLIVVSVMAAAVVVMVPAAALAGVHDANRGPKADRPVKEARSLEGTGHGTNTVNIATGSATYASSGHLSHFGNVTGSGVQTISFTGPSTVSFTGSGVTVAANGDQLFVTISGTGKLSSNGVAISTSVNTILGGTGRFVGATWTFTVISKSTPVSTVGSVETFAFTSTTEGHIDY